MRLALVTAIVATGTDEDMGPLLDACLRAGIDARVLAWDDATVSWSRFDLVLLRSPWDYTERLQEFMAWCERVDRASRLLNPLPILRWNTDKHYLADLAALGVAVVPTTFVEPDTDPLPALEAFLADAHGMREFVVKPAISAGARDTQRYARAQQFAAGNHIARLLDQGRSVMLQPYLSSVDGLGETALIYLDGKFSHAIRKGPLLRADEAATDALFATEAISPRQPADDERSHAESAMLAATLKLDLAVPPLYARVDLIRDADGAPRLLELELTEPSLFLAHAAGQADLMAALLVRKGSAAQ
jgi:O-ureido-D-serine cyclo-ligase